MVAIVFNERIHTVHLLYNHTIVDLGFSKYEVLLTSKLNMDPHCTLINTKLTVK